MFRDLPIGRRKARINGPVDTVVAEKDQQVRRWQNSGCNMPTRARSSALLK